MNEKEISLKFVNKVTGEAKLEKYANQLNIIKSTLGGIDTGSIKEIEKSEKSIAGISKDTAKISKLANVAFNYTTLRTLSRGMKALTTTMSSIVTQSSGFLEDFNLFQVAFNGNYQSAEKFVNKLSEMYGLDEGWLTRTTGIFKQLANAMDVSFETGEKLSELMTEMSIDISSLYNVDVERASSVLQSALAGQTKPIRSLTGGDITQATLQTTLDKLDIDRAISDLTFAEKRLLIIVSLTDQLSESAGDWGRTLESPANQTRILDEQWTRLTRALGNVFLPIVAKILPYLNAILMVLVDIINAIASLLGFELGDYDYFGSSTEDAWDFDDAVSSAGDSVDGLKKKMSGLRGFDKLNVITTPSSSGGSGGGGTGSGIDPRILDAFNLAFDKYQEKLEDVKMKAREIAEAFEEWAKCLIPLEKPLKEIAGLTYEGLIYVWNNVLKPLGKWIANDLIPTAVKTLASALEVVYEVGKVLFKIYKIIYETIVLPFARSIGKAIINSLQTASKILDAIAKSKVATTLLALVVAFKRLKNIVTLFLKTKIGKEFGAFTTLLFENVTGVKSLNNVWKNFITLVTPAKLKNITTEMTKMQKATVLLNNTMSALPTIVTGALIAFAGFETVKGSFEDIAENGISVGNVLAVVGGTIATVAGALTTLNAVTAIFGVTLTTIPIIGWIAGLTAVAGAIAGIIISQNEFNSSSAFTKKTIDELNETYDAFNDKMNSIKKSYDDVKESSEKNYQAKLAEIENSKSYISSLDDIVDGNYRVKDGYEDVAETILNELNNAYGTQLTLEDGVIKNNGKIIGDKQTLINITDEYAEAIKKQTLLEGYQALYKEAIQQKKKKKREYNNVTDTTNQKIEDTITKLSQGKITADEADKVMKKAKERQTKAEEKYKGVLNETNGTIEGLGKVTDAYATKSSTELEKTINTVTKAGKKSSETVKSTLDKNYDALNKKIKKIKKEQKEAYDEMMRNSTITYEMKLDDKSARRTYNKFASDINGAGGGDGLSLKYIPSTGRYATGGLPPVGQLFVANEKGPELVGQIGGQSFVANQNQMMDLLDRKIGNAQSNQGPQIYNIYLDESHKIGTYTLEQLQGMAKTNGKPITIGY